MLRRAELERSSASLDVDLTTIVFSAKEAIYKATFPLARRWLGFHDVEVDVDVDGETFEALVMAEADHPLAGHRLSGSAAGQPLALGSLPTAAAFGTSRKGRSRSTDGSLGRPRMRSPMMLRWIWSVPPPIEVKKALSRE